ncbi:MAG: C39 family peptidase [Clostridia bacterium]|nr:C39 family peptidase [Clostridia bacterium]
MDVTTKTSVNKSFSGSHKINVPLIAQKPEFPTGCESVSAVMALRYFGETIRVTDLSTSTFP